MRKALTLIVVVCTATLFSFGCTSEKGVGKFLSNTFKAGGSAVPVTVERVHRSELAVKVTLPAILTPSERFEVRLPHDARIERFMVNVGETVSRGALLFQLSKQEFQLKSSQLKAEQKELQANLEKNLYFLRNRDRLLEEGRITTEQYDRLEDEVDDTEDKLDDVRNKLIALESQSEDNIVTSPIAGVVQSKLTSAGGVAAANNAIITIVKNNPMVVNFRLASYQAKAVKKDQPVEVILSDLPGEHFSAKIESIGTELDRDSGTFEVKATLNNPQGMLKAGMNAFVEFTGPETQRFYVIPADALVISKRRYYVFTVRDGVAHRRRVIPRAVHGDTAEIIQGLHDGDLVVIKGSEKLKEGTMVDIWR